MCKQVKIGLVLLWIELKSGTTVLMQKLVKKKQLIFSIQAQV